MKKNYYEILEIDKNASPEIIKKAYSILAKKYHPDLQPEYNKSISEAKFKLINEAYETLSDVEKRKQYDLSIRSNTISLEQYNSIILENQELKRIINELTKENQQNNVIIDELQNSNTIPANDYINNNYNNYYNDYYSDNNHHFLNKIKSIFSIILAILIVFFLLKIPFIRNIIFSNITNRNAIKYAVYYLKSFSLVFYKQYFAISSVNLFPRSLYNEKS